MKQSILVILFSSLISVYGQYTPTELGYRHLEFTFENVLTDVLIISQEGKANEQRPLFFFCQGSLPIPLIVYDDQGVAGVVPFNPDLLISTYHIVIVGKPGIPVSKHMNELNPDMSFSDKPGEYPHTYLVNNHLDFYVKRNNFILKNLAKMPWVNSDRIVVAGHSEGATVAAKMALENPKIDALIFASGNPMGRIMSMIQRSRKYESAENPYAENDFEYWNYQLDQAESKSDSIDYYAQTDYSFSVPPMNYLTKVKIPVLICYGSVDYSTPFNDYFRVFCSSKDLDNIHFSCYVGLDHNYFGVDNNGQTNYDDFNWNRVAEDWAIWLSKGPAKK